MKKVIENGLRRLQAENLSLRLALWEAQKRLMSSEDSEAKRKALVTMMDVDQGLRQKAKLRLAGGEALEPKELQD